MLLLKYILLLLQRIELSAVMMNFVFVVKRLPMKRFIRIWCNVIITICTVKLLH